MFKGPVKKHGVNGYFRQKGKIAELALGYGGSVGALKAMGALEMGLTEEELPPLVEAWRQSNSAVVGFWWQIDRAVMNTVRLRMYHLRGSRRYEEAGTPRFLRSEVRRKYSAGHLSLKKHLIISFIFLLL